MTVKESTATEATFTAEQMVAAAEQTDINTQELRSDITVLFGSGANITVLDDPDGKIMVDSGFSVSQPRIEAALDEISNRPIRYLINSHFHFDHTDGNSWVHRAGAEIIAESHTRLRLSLPQPLAAFRTVRPAAPFSALPTISFNHLMHVELRNESIFLKRYSPAHTDSDIAVYFEQHDVLHVGDTWFNGIYPFIDYDGGGSIDGLISAAEQNLDLSGPKTLVVPGHGGVGTRDDLLEFYDMLVEVRARVTQLKATGRSLEQVIETNPTARFDGKCAQGFIPSDLFVCMVYRGV